MPLISKAAAIEVLQPYFGVIYKCVTEAWGDYLKYPDWARIAHDQTTRANIINNHMILRATAAFLDDPKVKIVDGGQRQSLFVFNRHISLRLKKLDKEFMPQNVATKQVEKLNGQKEIEEIDAAHHLVIGYKLNTHQTEIDGIYLVCPNNKKIFWEAKIENEQIVSTIHNLLESIEAEEYGSGFEKKEDATDTEKMENGTKDQP